jgi:hypothetical protein
MSLLGQSLLLYVLAGVGVAVAVYLRADAAGRLQRAFRVATAVVFWPLYVPLLLARAGEDRPAATADPAEAPRDELAAAIAQVEAELAAALAGLQGWADEVLARERKRLQHLPAVWVLQAERIRAVDRCLAVPDGAPSGDNSSIIPPGLVGEVRSPGVSERLRHSQEARRQNREHLRRLRRCAHDDLLGTLAWVRELLSMLHLARFTGAPPARAEELLGQIVAASEGLAEVTWKDERPAAAGGST